jgi:hypothetical protein
VNLVQAVSPTAGLLHHKIVAATMTAERFQTFVEELLEVVSSRNDIGDADQMHIVMDGARFHGRMQIPEQYAANWGGCNAASLLALPEPCRKYAFLRESGDQARAFPA